MVYPHKALSPRKAPTTALNYRPSVSLHIAGMQTGGRVRSRIDARHRGSQQPPQGPAWALGKLPTRRMCLSSVPDCIYSKVAGLGRDSLIYTGPDRSHNPIYSTIQHYPFRNLLNNPYTSLNTLLIPYYIT